MEAIEFCERLSRATGKNYRFPTEAEWEYACRAGTTTPFAYGSSLSSQQANFDGDNPYGNAAKGKNLGKTTAVGSYQANGWGLYDIHGNVLEWCMDRGAAYPSWAQRDPVGPSTGSDPGRILRGGSWSSDARFLRSAFRHVNENWHHFYDVGFRLVRTYN